MSTIPVNQAMDQALELHQEGKLSGAAEIYKQILARSPNNPDALHLLGVLCAQMDRLEEGVSLIQRALAFNPVEPRYFFNLGSILVTLRRLDQAIEAYQKAVTFNPHYFEAYDKLGVVLKDKGDLNAAVAACRQAIKLKPDFIEAHIDLGNVFQTAGQLDEAIACYREALRIDPKFAVAWNNLGNALHAQGRLQEAAEAYTHALQIVPGWAEIQNNLANTLKDQGDLDAAIAAFRKAISLKPGLIQAHNNLIWALHYHPDSTPQTIQTEQWHWNAQHAAPLKKFIQPCLNNRDPKRRLRVGYVSPDFRAHVVGWNLLPLLENHDHRQFEIFCFSSVAKPDAITQRIRSLTDAWRNILGLGDQKAAEMVREERIDILVDLAVHTAFNRLLLFAYKPAPIQVTWLGYPGSTGMDVVDYRLSDPYIDPPGTDLSVYSEQTMLLPNTYWCYQPAIKPRISDSSPFSSTGFITFGCMNKFAKVSAPALNSWLQILKSVPDSHFILHCNQGVHRQAVLERFTQAGIAPDRIELVGLQPLEQYFDVFNRIDIALDPFPYNGGITTCDALYMGVPVVSLSGKTAVGRAGHSILTNVGVPELIAETPEEYVQIAVKLAGDLPRLKELRSSLRRRMEESPLMGAKSFAREVELIYRDIWRKWCTLPLSR